VKIFLPAGYKVEDGNPRPVIVPYTKKYAPDTNAGRLWLMNRQPELWRGRQEIAVKDDLAAMTPEQRLANVLEIMAKARALLAEPDDEDEDEMTDAGYEEVDE
jgi:hypothetical protein